MERMNSNLSKASKKKRSGSKKRSRKKNDLEVNASADKKPGEENERLPIQGL